MRLSDALYNFLGSIGYTHPPHPPLVHMPIGLVIGAMIFDFAAPYLPKPRLERAAYYCLVLAFLFYFPVVVLGYLDWQHYFAGAWIFDIKMKLTLAATLLVLLSLALILGRTPATAPRSLKAVYVLAFLNVVALGYFGGQLVYAGKTPTAPVAYLAGQKLFDANCASCHPQGGNVVVPNLPVTGAPQLASRTTFIAWLRDPKRPNGSPGMMPAFPPASITDAQAEDLRQYIVNVLENPRAKTSATSPGSSGG